MAEPRPSTSSDPNGSQWLDPKPSAEKSTPEENDQTVDDSKSNDDKDRKQPFEYIEHIQGRFKKARNRCTSQEIEKKMTEEQIREEREVQKKQLEAIFKLMQEQSDKFGVNSFNEVEDQMKLYTS